VNTSLVLNDILLFGVPHVSALIISRCQPLVRMKSKTSVQHSHYTERDLSLIIFANVRCLEAETES